MNAELALFIGLLAVLSWGRFLFDLAAAEIRNRASHYRK